MFRSMPALNINLNLAIPALLLRAMDLYASQRERQDPDLNPHAEHPAQSCDHSRGSVAVLPYAPRSCASSFELVQDLLVPEGIHALPEALVSL